MRKPDVIELTKEQRATASANIKEYMLENFDVDAGNLKSEIFVDFITNTIGAYYYNKAVADSLAFMTEKAEDLYLLMKDEA